MTYIYGIHPIEEMLLTQKGAVGKVYCKENIKMPDVLRDLLKKTKVPFSFVPEYKIEALVGDVVHQGVVAEITPVAFVELDEFIQTLDLDQNPALVLFDELEDPGNVGAIIRTGTALGVSGFLFPKHRQVGLSAGVYKSSAGTIGRVPLVRVGNVNDVLRTLKEKRFWIVGLDGTAPQTLWKEDFAMPIVFVIGGEAEGLRVKTKELCDFLISIPMQHGVESLNASVSTALVLGEWYRRRV